MSDNTVLAQQYDFRLAPSLSATEKHIIQSYLTLLANDLSDSDLNSSEAIVVIKNIVDGRGLACPMPLLKTKVALRGIAVNESLYVIATDANSQNDIAAFCKQNQHNTASAALNLTLNQMTGDIDKTLAADTIYHFIITKTDSN